MPFVHVILWACIQLKTMGWYKKKQSAVLFLGETPHSTHSQACYSFFRVEADTKIDRLARGFQIAPDILPFIPKLDRTALHNTHHKPEQKAHDNNAQFSNMASAM